MASEIFCRQKSSNETEYTNDEALNEKTVEDLREDVAQLEHVNASIQKQLVSCQKEAEETIESLHQQLRSLQLDRDAKEKTSAQLQKRLKFLTEDKVEAGTQTVEVISAPRHRHRSASDNNHRVLILGDSHGRHIAQLLAEDLGPMFSVSGVLKPHASLEQVTANIGGLAKGFGKTDFLAVIVGDSHVDVVTYLWGLMGAAGSTNLLLGLVPVRVDTRDESQPTLVLVDESRGTEDGSAYLIPIRRDRPGSLGRGAKKQLSAKMADVILHVLGNTTTEL